MIPDRWRKLEQLFQSALTLGEAERAAFLADACRDDDELRREVELLLSTPASSGSEDARAAGGPTLPGDLGSAVLTGRRFGPYQLTARLGVGGMGEVYRARDPRLGRDVAIKVLPARFTSDRGRLARFEQEARVLAVLNHPCIGAIYGLEDSDGLRGLVLELVEGETLADRLARGPVPVLEALRIAAQIADAIEAAHDRGVVHRDLKPANIKITPAGLVKVLDFGLAKAIEDEGTNSAASRSPTLAGVTEQGVIVGTPAYMSPEQARGEAVDKRTDVWAFGCVVYEMLTGRSVFAGKTLFDTIAAVLRQEPDWSRLPPDAPPGTVRLLRSCLEKNVARRAPDVAGIKPLLLQESAADPGVVAKPTKRAMTLRGWMVAAGALTLVAVALVMSRGWRSTPVERAIPSSVTRTSVTLPSNQALDFEDGVSPLAISPDGRRLAYVGRSANRSQLYVRSLDAFDAKQLPGTEGAEYPFFSPDGEWVAFFANRKLARVPVAGGSPVVICEVPPDWRGGTWAPDGTIVFARGTAGLMRVSTRDGRVEAIRNPDAVIETRGVSWPRFLPDGHTLLVSIGQEARSKQPASLAVFSLDTDEWRVLGPGIQADYVPPGYVVFHAPHVMEGRIEAVAFDAKQRRFAGTPVPVLDGIFRARNGGAAFFSVAANGTLVFARGGFERTVVSADRNGRRTALSDDRRGFRFPRLSPDGRYLAVTIDPRPSEIWVYDLERSTRLRLAGDGRHNLGPVWTSDGRYVSYSSQTNIYRRAADGSASSELVLAMDRNEYPSWWSSDGHYLVFHRTEVDNSNRYDIWSRYDARDPQPLLASTASELNPRLSPDGRWMAHTSDESGQLEVHIRSFPDVTRKHWPVSSSGGHSPVWARDGRELFYMSGATVMAVRVEPRADGLALGAPVSLFSGPFDTTQDRNFDVFPDGQRFVMVEADQNAAPTSLNVVVNWTEELKRTLSGTTP